MKQSSLFSLPEREKARNFRAKLCIVFTYEQKAQRVGKTAVYNFQTAKTNKTLLSQKKYCENITAKKR